MRSLDQDILFALSMTLHALNVRAQGTDTGQRILEARGRRFEIAFTGETYEIVRELT